MKSPILAALLVCAAVAPAHAASVITADRMLDVQTGRYVESPAIFVDDAGRISSIADARTVRWGANVKHVDLSGKTLVPGLIGMHDHGSGLNPDSLRVEADFEVDGTPAGENLAKRFKPLPQGVWVLNLSKPVAGLKAGRLVVSVADRQGNVTRVERRFSVAT